jgi:hypothetical protein
MKKELAPNSIVLDAKPFYRGGEVNNRGHPLGTDLIIKYHVKDVDSVPAMLAPGEWVLTKKHQKIVNNAFRKAKMKSFL